jgi:cystine transport system substrate-binding protein
MKLNKLLKSLLAISLVIPVLTACGSSNKETTLLDEIKEKGEITFATEGTYSPFSYHDDSDELVGYDVDIAKAVAEKLGVKATFVETKWDGIIAGLDAKKYDVISNQVGITDERKEKYLFSDTYTYSYGVVLTKKDNTDITKFEDLSGKKSAQTTTSNWADVVRDYGGEIVATEGFNQSIELVLQGRADATVNDSVTYLDYLKQKPDANIKVAAQSTEVSESAFLLRQEDGAELQEAINQALTELREEGTLAKISEQYFGEDVSTAK